MKENEENARIESDSSLDDAAHTDDDLSVLAQGNPMLGIFFSFFAAALLLAFELYLLFGDIYVVPEAFGSQIKTKILICALLLVILCIFLLYGIALCKRAKTYYSQKRKYEKSPFDETVDLKIEQRTCPQCGDIHDADYPKCPKCKFTFF